MPTLQLSAAEDQARIALMDRFDLLLQADSIYEAMSMVDSVDEIEEKPDWLQWSNHEIRQKLAEKLEIYDQALFELNQLLQFFEARRADETLLLQTYYRRGDILLKMRQYDLAFEDFFKGAGEGNESKDACSNANFNHRLGMVSYQQTNYEDAKHYFLQAFPLFDGCDSKYSALYRQQEVASNIGLCYWRLQQYDSSLVWYDQSLRIIERLPLNSKADEYRAEIARWVTQGNKGLALYQNDSYAAGRKLMRNSFEWNLGFVYGDKSHAAFIGNSLAAFLIDEKKLKEASAIMQKLDSAGVLQPNSPAQLNALLNKVNWFAAMGDGDSSHYHFGQYLLVSDTIRQNSRELIKMNTR
jgi:tetratricopeptide (TPR) repeat protein